MYKMLCVAACTLLLTACGSTAPDSFSRIAKTNVVKANTIEKKKVAPPDGTLEKQGYICRTERRMNSRFGNTVCRTPAQIAAEKAMARESVPRHRDCMAPSYMCKD
ncbi:MAG: hypothetical protein E6Q75_11635 [Rheinheimera sp.]|nr:MAG: hypothetical protein E6Q75_11635 [Rheinheimera sp.]